MAPFTQPTAIPGHGRGESPGTQGGMAGFRAPRVGSRPPWCHGDVHEPDDWIRTFRATLPELYAFVARRTGGERTLAEDVTQETWLRAVQAWRTKGLPSEPIAWLKTTARNLVLNHFRDARRRPLARVELDLERQPMPSGGDGSGGDATGEERVAAMQHALARMRPADAQLIEAFHLDGCSTRELAATHRTSERAIEGRLHRARAKLKQVLGQLGDPTS